MWFQFQVWIGKKLKIDGAPICRISNDANTESYTLRNDGWVIIQGKKQKTTDALPIFLCSHNLQEKFATELTK